jgi:hypothetical protein
VSDKLAAGLPGVPTLLHPLSVKVANGSIVGCVSQIQHAQWQIQGLQFCSDRKILPLQHIDMVLGFDWL